MLPRITVVGFLGENNAKKYFVNKHLWNIDGWSTEPELYNI